MPTPDEARAIGHAIAALRPGWLATSIATGILRHHPTRPARDVALALVMAAYDPRVETPGVINKPGPWWDHVDAVNGPTPPHAPDAPDAPVCVHCRKTREGCAHAQAVVAESVRFVHEFTPRRGGVR